MSSRVGRGRPDPVILLGQLAVDERYRGRRLAAAGVVGARTIVVQAIDERAAAFYAKFGFRPFSNREPLMLILRMSEIEGLLRAYAPLRSESPGEPTALLPDPAPLLRSLPAVRRPGRRVPAGWLPTGAAAPPFRPAQGLTRHCHVNSVASARPVL